MKYSDIPTKFTIPFANAAGAGFIRTIPVASQIGITNGAASLTDGFPPDTFLPVGAGGVPPFGQDFNGILKEITAWSRWQNAGGLVEYDGTYAAAVGGYPQGALLAGATAGVMWLNTVDDNTTNPDAGGAGWISVPTGSSFQNASWIYATDTGAANTITVAFTPAITALTAGMALRIKLLHSLTGASTITVNGLPAKTLLRADNTPTQSGDGLAGEIINAIFDGTNFQLSQFLSSQIPPRNQTAYTAAGTYTFTVPSGVFWVFGQVVGGGGGGGGRLSGAAWSGGSGGAGGYAQGWVAVVPGQTITVTVGAGGTAGPGNGNTAGTGGTSSFGAYMSATGGAGGSNGSGTASAGSGGVGTGGQLAYRGGSGGAGSATDGTVPGGSGGASFFGGGGRSGGAALDALVPGSGGGGIYGASSNFFGVGGAGADGAVLVSY